MVIQTHAYRSIRVSKVKVSTFKTNSCSMCKQLCNSVCPTHFICEESRHAVQFYDGILPPLLNLPKLMNVSCKPINYHDDYLAI